MMLNYHFGRLFASLNSDKRSDARSQMMDSEPERTIAKYAADLHKSDYSALTIKVSESDLELLRPHQLPESTSLNADNELAFAEIADRNFWAARYYFEQFRQIRNINDEEMIAEFSKLWLQEHGEQELVSARAWVLVHEDNDPFAALIAALKKTRQYSSEEHALSGILGGLILSSEEITVERVFDLIEDAPPASLNSVVLSKFADSVKASEKILELLEKHLTEKTAHVYLATINSLAKSDSALAYKRIFGHLSAADSLLKEVSLKSLGNIWVNAAVEIKVQVESLISNSRLSKDERIQKSVLESIEVIAQESPVFDVWLLEECCKGNKEACSIYTKALSTRKSLSETELNERLPLLSRCIRVLQVNPNHLDSLIAKLLVDDQTHDAAVRCIEAWISAEDPHKYRIAGLFQTVQVLLSSKRFTSIVTKWFYAEGCQNSLCLAHILDGTKHLASRLKSVVFEKGTTPTDLSLTCNRIVLFLHDPEYQISLFLSLLQNLSDGAQIATACEIMFREVVSEYPAVALKAVQDSLAADTYSNITRARIKDAIKDFEAYMNDLNKLPRRKELQMPLDLQRAALERFQRMIQAGFDKSKESAVWSLIATQLPMIGAMKSIDSNKVESYDLLEGKLFTFNQDYPVGAITDEVGYSIRRTFFLDRG
jgi:hypothetical protein